MKLGLMACSGTTDIDREPCRCSEIKTVCGTKTVTRTVHTPPRECRCGYVQLRTDFEFCKRRGSVILKIEQAGRDAGIQGS